MHVAHIITRLIIGGAQENTLLTVEGQHHDHGDTVTLITGPGLGPEGSLVERAKAGGLDIRIVPEMRRNLNPWRDWASYRALIRMLRDLSPDLVHTHSSKAGIIGRAAAAKLKIPAVHTIHGAAFHVGQNPLAKAAYIRAEKWAAKRCQKLVGVCDAMAEQYISAGIAPPEKFVTVYSGMETGPFLSPPRQPEEVRKELGLAPEHIVIGKVARLFHLKGHEYVIEAAKAVADRCPQARFLFVGDGILREQFESDIAGAGMTDRFVFTGLVPPAQVAELIHAMDIVVHTSLWEGLARVLPQGLIAGKPVVSYDVDGAKEMLDRLGRWLKKPFQPEISEEEFARQRAEILERAPVPVTWMFGKTGSGKSSVVSYLTGTDAATIGTGFKPETKASYRYAFPTAEHPILQFLDTRGLGESHYDPAEDIATFDREANAMLVTVRLLDNALDAVLSPLRKIRAANPKRPVLLLLTCLHEAYPQEQHPDPDPYGDADIPDNISETLARSLRNQHSRFEGLVDRVVPVDFTHRDDGFQQPDFGGERLKETFIELLPDVFSRTFASLDDVMGSLQDLHERRAAPYIMSASVMSATAGAVPVPWIDLPVVAGIQADMMRRISALYGQPMDVQQFLKLSGAVTGPMMLRQGARELLKFIPGVGSTANAALAFATTYALGKSCCWYFGQIVAGHAPTPEELRSVMNEQMNVAKTVWKKREESTK
eukprot:g26526.t1